MPASICEITWGLSDGALAAWCSDCDETALVLQLPDQDVGAWAREHWLTVHPWAERVRVVRAVSSPPTEDWWLFAYEGGVRGEAIRG